MINNLQFFMSKHARLEGLDPDNRGDEFTTSYIRGIEFTNVGSALMVNLSNVTSISTSMKVTGGEETGEKIYRIHFRCGKNDEIVWLYTKHDFFMSDFQRLINVRSSI